MQNFLLHDAKPASIVLISAISLLFALLVGDIGIIFFPLIFGWLFLYLPVSNWRISYSKKGFLHKLTSVQLGLSVVFGFLVTLIFLIAAWNTRFCPKTRLYFGDNLGCEDKHDLFLSALTDAHTLIFNKILHLGNNWYWFWGYVFLSMAVAGLITSYFLIKKVLVSRK